MCIISENSPLKELNWLSILGTKINKKVFYLYHHYRGRFIHNTKYNPWRHITATGQTNPFLKLHIKTLNYYEKYVRSSNKNHNDVFIFNFRSKSKEHPKFSCYDQPGNYLPTSDRIWNPLPTRILNKFFDQ